MKAYKYRANLLDAKTLKRRDTVSLLEYEFYASQFENLNDPFEGSFELKMVESDKEKFYQRINPIDRGYILWLYQSKKKRFLPMN